MLMMSKDAAAEEGPRPVKAIPSHFSEVQEAMAEDVAKIFGSEGDAEGRYFSIGHPLDMDTQVCLDMIRFAERSNGIFGKTRHGQVLPDAAGAVRADSLRQGRQPDL